MGQQLSFQVFLSNTKGEMKMKEELSKEEEELVEMVAINDDDIYSLAGKRSKMMTMLLVLEPHVLLSLI